MRIIRGSNVLKDRSGQASERVLFIVVAPANIVPLASLPSHDSLPEAIFRIPLFFKSVGHPVFVEQILIEQ